MIRLEADPFLAARARARLAQLDAAAGGLGTRHVADADRRARGPEAEELFARWLDGEFLTYTRHGGVDLLPDFELTRRLVGVRYCGSRTPWTPAHSVYAFRYQLEHAAGWDWSFLGPVVDGSSTRDMYLLGFSTTAELERGRFVRAGEYAAGMIAERDLYLLSLAELEQPSSWLGREWFDGLTDGLTG